MNDHAPPSEQECISSWHLVARAAAGEEACRSEFGRRYIPLVRAYLAARWEGTPWSGELEDAAQEVFVECFKPNGVIERANHDAGGEFRSFLLGVIRHVARRFERSAAQRHGHREKSSIYHH